MKKLEADWLKAPYGASAIVGLLKDQWKLNPTIIAELPEIFYQGPGAIVHDLLNLQLNRDPQEVIQDERMYNLVAFRRVRKKFLRWLMTQSQRFDRFLEVYPTLESQKDLVNNIFLFACEHGEQKGFDSPLVLIQEMFEIIEEGRNKNWRLLKDTLPLNTGICIAADLGIVELVELLGNHGADPGTQYDYPIRIACEKGRVEVVRLLLRSRRVNPTANNNLALQCAAENGHIEVVRLLLNHTKILFDTNSAILAVANGHAEVARLLLYHPNVDLRDINLIMKDCVIFGNADILKLLLGHPKADPSIDNNYLIVIAAKKRGPEFVRLLLEDKKVAKSISFEDLEWIEKKFVSLKDICDQIKISRMPKFDSRDAEEQPKKILKK